MFKRVRSARGEIIDFELIHIKQQLAQVDLTVDVVARKDFIEHRENGKSIASFAEDGDIVAPTSLNSVPVNNVPVDDVEDSFLIDVKTPVVKKPRG